MESSGPTSTDTPVSSGAHAQTDRVVAAVTAVLLVVGMAIAYFTGGDTSTGEVIAFFVLTGLWLAAIAFLELRQVPSWRAGTTAHAANIALVLGVLAVITVVVFWTGLPFPLGAGAIMLGLSLRGPGPQVGGGGKATAAAALGLLGIVASFVAMLAG